MSGAKHRTWLKETAVLGRCPFLDRHVHEIAPLGPRSVVVAYVLVAEQLPEHEPRVGAALADAAVSSDLLVRRHTFPRVQVAKLVGGFERPVVAHRLRPRNRLRRRDV